MLEIFDDDWSLPTATMRDDVLFGFVLEAVERGWKPTNMTCLSVFSG